MSVHMHTANIRNARDTEKIAVISCSLIIRPKFRIKPKRKMDAETRYNKQRNTNNLLL